MHRSAQRALSVPVHDPHIECLRTVSVVLNRYQDIEDILDNKELGDKVKLRLIKRINDEIGKVASKYLPG